MRQLLPLAAACLAGLAPAQADHSLVLPLSAAATEGDSADTTLLNLPYLRWQQVDTDSKGNPHLVKWIALRRDGLLAAPAAKGRTVDIQIDLGLGSLQTFGTRFADNTYAGSTTTAFSRQPVSLPDWSQIPTSPPAAFDLTLLCSFLYAHSGIASLVFEIQVWDRGAGLGSYPLDAVSANGSATATSTARGIGCTTGNGVFAHAAAFSVTGFGAATSLTLSASNAPGGAPVTVLLGLNDPNLALGLCASLRTDALLPVPLGTASVLGAASASFPTGAYNAYWQGFALHSQAYAPDPGQPGGPIALSDGVQVVLPRLPYDMRHTFATDPTATHGQGPFQGGLVIQIADTP